VKVALAALLLISACTDPDTIRSSVNDETPTLSSSMAEDQLGNTLLPPSCWESPSSAGKGSIAFLDATATVGLVDPLIGMYGHSAIWTYGNSDNEPDLYFGTFATRNPSSYRHRGAHGASPDRLLVSTGSGFEVDERLGEEFSRSSGGVSADLDGDGTVPIMIAGVSRVILQTSNIPHEPINANPANAKALFDSLSKTSQNATAMVTSATMRRQPPWRSS
jgi:hypothetical protein